ncbi:hypothetical protein BJ546DRAFT_980944 [Cryomyces antarcticus]
MFFNCPSHFCIYTSAVITILPQLATSLSIPRSLQQPIPLCAQPCLASFIAEGYPTSTCLNQRDLACLCSHYSTTGYTLGEVALSCVHSSCSDQAVSNSSSVYDLCVGQTGAVTQTHKTLTITASQSQAVSVTTVVTTVSAMSISVESGTIGANAFTSTASSTTFETSTASSTSAAPSNVILTASGSPTVPTQFPPSASSSSTSPNTAVPSQSLTKAQLVGVSVAGAASVILLLAVVILVTCVKVRKASRRRSSRDSFDFADKTPRAHTPPPSTDAIGPRGGNGGVEVAPLRWSDSGQKQQRWSSRQPGLAPWHIGVALSPEMEQTGSPDSVRSTRTVSQLLPDRPNVTSITAIPRTRPASNMTGITVFEEDRPSRNVTPRFLFPLPPSQTYAPPRYANQHTLSPEKTKPPPLQLAMPVNQPRNQLVPPSINVPRIVYIPRNSGRSSQFPTPKHSSTYSNRPSVSIPPTSAARSSASYLPTYYTGVSSHEASPLPDLPRSNHSSTSNGYLTPRKASSKSARASLASETSFESADPGEPTPPDEEDKQLSPVAESPLSRLRYPKIPRASNQIVPRSPRQSSSSTQSLSWRQSLGYSPATLLARRRGARAAKDLEHRLWITESYGRSNRNVTDSSRGHCRSGSHNTLRHYDAHTAFSGGRASYDRSYTYSQTRRIDELQERWVGIDSPRTELVIKSPLWEPKLTPTRRGDNLYIAVS